MERVLYNLHHKCCTFALHHTSRRSRSWAEHSILVFAVCGFGALLLGHLTFVHRIGTAAHQQRSIGVSKQHVPLQCLPSIPGFDRETAVTHLVLLDDDSVESHVIRRPPSNSSTLVGKEAPVCLASDDNSDSVACKAESSAVDDDSSYLGNVLFSYSHEKGYLLLSPELRQRHGIEAQYVLVSKRDARCFGEPFVQSLVFYSMLSTDTVMINWLLGVYQLRGYIYNPRTRVVTDLARFQSYSSYSWNTSRDEDKNDTWRYFEALLRKIQQLAVKGMIIVKTSFLFFITTTLVSFTLRETQGRMLDFTHYLAEFVRTNRPVVNLVTTHVVENLIFVPMMVGMIFFLIEFYRGDKFLAFMVLSLVWLCESFSVVRYE